MNSKREEAHLSRSYARSWDPNPGAVMLAGICGAVNVALIQADLSIVFEIAEHTRMDIVCQRACSSYLKSRRAVGLAHWCTIHSS